MKPTSRQHLTDERLIDTYFARVGDRSGSEAVQTACEHVEACEVCSRRVAELTASLENLRQEAVAEADAYFTSDRLAAQQDRVMRHLEGVEHPARVIPFPQTSPRATGDRDRAILCTAGSQQRLQPGSCWVSPEAGCCISGAIRRRPAPRLARDIVCPGAGDAAGESATPAGGPRHRAHRKSPAGTRRSSWSSKMH